MAKELTNTERLIANIKHCMENGNTTMHFYVGRYTGNGPSVVAALRRRGYSVSKTNVRGRYEVSI